ncbi:MAG: hypothetical protein K5764_01235 [Prevotella sp.]|nr:hypothetical protein [Prevotella sp.]
MYEDYDGNHLYLGGLGDEPDDYTGEIDEYDVQLDSLADDECLLDDRFESQMREIDEYWDRENQYIVDSGVYTKKEVKQILADHEVVRESKKEDVRAVYEREKEHLSDAREQLLFEREMAMQRSNVYWNGCSDSHTHAAQQRPSFIQQAITATAVYHFLKRIF